MIYERIKRVLPNSNTPQFPRREVAKVVRFADGRETDERAKKRGGRKRERERKKETERPLIPQ